MIALNKFTEKAKLCYMDTDSFIVYIKTDDIYKDVTEDVEKRLNTSSYWLDRPLPKEEIKKGVQIRLNERWINSKKHEIISTIKRAKTYNRHELLKRR